MIPTFLIHGMKLTFLGNTYTRSSELQLKPDVQLRYQGKLYQARRLQAKSTLESNSIVLTYRGVVYKISAGAALCI